MARVKIGDTADQFMAGLQTIWQTHHIPDGATPFVRNVDFSRNPGAISKRRGQAIYISTNGAGYVTGFHEFTTAAGVTTLFAAVNTGVVYSVAAPSTWTSRLTGAGDENVEFATFQDLCIAVNPNIATQKSSGAAFSALAGLPPANGKYLIVFKNRLWIANTSAGKSRLHFSAEGNAEDWTTVGSAGFIDINLDDGDEITGLGVCGGTLFVFKKFSIHTVTGFKPDNFVVAATPAFEGCVNNKTIKNMGTFLVYLSERSVNSIAPGGFVSELSTNIRGDIEDMTATAKSLSAGGKKRFQYWLAYDSDADGFNDKAYVLDFNTQSWSLYDNIKSQVFLTRQDTTLMSGGSDLQIIRQHDTTENDESNNITMRWRSKEFDVTSWLDIKILNTLWTSARVLDSKNLTVVFIVDGTDMGSPQTISLTAPISGNTSLVSFIRGLQSLQGRHIQIEYQNAEASAPVVIDGFAIDCDIHKDQYSI